MKNRRTIEYEYKMISSFYDNWFKCHRYQEIKRIVIGRFDYRNISEGEFIYKMHQFLLLMSTWSFDEIAMNVEKTFNFIFEREMNYESLLLLKSVLDKHESLFEKSFKFIETSIDDKTSEEAFVFFCVAGKLINATFSDYVVLPVNLFEHIKQLSTDNNEIRIAFYKGLIASSVKKHETSLKEEIKKIYSESKEIFVETNIQEIYLFGSIVDDTYCDTSDIDLIIKVKAEEDFEESRLFLKEFNKRYFDRRSDIQEYNAFMERDFDLPYERLY